MISWKMYKNHIYIQLALKHADGIKNAHLKLNFVSKKKIHKLAYQCRVII